MDKRTQKELADLKRIYEYARDMLLDIIVNYTGVGTKVYYNTVLQGLNEAMQAMQKGSNKFISTAVPREYKKGLDDVYGYFKRNNLMMDRPDMFAAIHFDSLDNLVKELQYNIGQGQEQVGRQILRYLDDAQDNALRRAGLEAAAEKVATGSTVRDMQDNLKDKLQQEGFMTVQYGQGKNAYQVSLDSYVQMCARSTTREAGNIARENQLTSNGYDLVQMTTHYPTCELCAQLQGRVYSISGKDRRFPALSLAWNEEYHNVHPNCRHSIHPWIEALRSDAEINEAIKTSNMPFEDTRSKAEIKLYNEQQSYNRRLRQDRYQYERYKVRLGANAPKTFSAFKRIKKAGGERWNKLQKAYRQQAQ